MSFVNPSGTPVVNPSGTKLDIASSSYSSTTATTQSQQKSGNSLGGLLSSICCCICSFICFILIVRGLMPRNTKTIVQQIPPGQPIVQ